MEPLRSLHRFNKPTVKPKLPKGHFHRGSVIPSAQPCVVSIFGLGLGLGLELRLCKIMSTEPPRRHHGCFLEPWRHHGCIKEPSRSLRGATRNSSNNDKPPNVRTIHCTRYADVLFVQKIHAEYNRNFVPYTSNFPAHLLAVYMIEIRLLSS